MLGISNRIDDLFTYLEESAAEMTKIIFIGPPPLYTLYPAGPKSGGTLSPTPPGCAAHA